MILCFPFLLHIHGFYILDSEASNMLDLRSMWIGLALPENPMELKKIGFFLFLPF